MVIIMSEVNFIIYSIPGGFLNSIKKAQFLRSKGFKLIIRDGEICFKNVNEYMKAYLALSKSGNLTEDEQKQWKDLLVRNLTLKKRSEEKKRKDILVNSEKHLFTVNIVGNFLDVYKIAMFLRKNGFDVNVSNGNVGLTDINSYMMAYKLLKKNNMIKKKDENAWKNEIYTKLKYKYALNRNYEYCKQGNNRVLMSNDSGDYLSIIRQVNKKTNKVEYSIMARNKDSICSSIEKMVPNRISSYYISEVSPLYEVAKHYNKLGNVSKNIKFIPSTNGYVLNIIDDKPKNYYSETCSLSFSSNEVLESLYNSIYSSEKKEKDIPKKYVKVI